jgi:hypothetical protein
MITATCLVLMVICFACVAPDCSADQGGIQHNPAKKFVTVSDADGSLVVRLSYDGQCVLDRVGVRGREVIAAKTGVSSGVKVGDKWYTARSLAKAPRVSVTDAGVTVDDIDFGGDGVHVNETWVLEVRPYEIVWTIRRRYLSGGTVEDTCIPSWEFAEMSTWTGALLDNGGVAWCRFLDTPEATYGAHTGPVTFWNRENNACLRITPQIQAEDNVAVRFSRRPGDGLTFCHSVTGEKRVPKHQLRRFLPDRQDVWAPLEISPSEISVRYRLQALDYKQAYDRGTFVHFDGDSIREILNTIARVGVVDTRFHGSNNWRLGYAVLHEKWIAQLNLAINDPHYTAAYAGTLDYQRDHAIDEAGRVKSRWAYGAWDAMPGTYDQFGYYEAQWGYLMDSQTGYVTNVVEQFDQSGDMEWVRSHRATCRRALEYLLRRDSDGDGLVAMMTDKHTEARGSDWIDVVWASYENALINAEMYNALLLWADVEQLLGDLQQADAYRRFAEKLKVSFNKSIAEGGFWNPDQQWYVYWRDKDDTIHGDNLVTPVNFMAIAYDICDQPDRREAILRRVESEMQSEGLFFWPLCFFSYQPGEAAPSQFPFPEYENGEIFLAWGELGIRAYVKYDPRIPLKYIQNVLRKYDHDGLAFQRYDRRSQTGEGTDILANNCSPVVGLYRNIYGIQPRYNRLYLEPHLTPELDGTQLKYSLRNQHYTIDLQVGDYAATVNNFKVRDKTAFGVSSAGNAVGYFHGEAAIPSMSITRSEDASLAVSIVQWDNSPNGPREWTESCDKAATTTDHVIGNLTPNASYRLYRNGTVLRSVLSDSAGCVKFTYTGGYEDPQTFSISR